MKDTLVTIKNEVVTKEGILEAQFHVSMEKKKKFRNYSSMQDNS